MTNVWQVKIATLFPEVFPGILGTSVIGKALRDGIWSLDVANLRDFSDDKFRRVDNPPSGGGGGMVIRPDVIAGAVNHLRGQFPQNLNVPAFYLSPRGELVNQDFVNQLSKTFGAIFVCGRYEGIDQRAINDLQLKEISIGDYVLSGGEVATTAIIEASVRLLPRVLGNEKSATEDSLSNALLEHDQYSCLKNWNGYDAPEILASGNHKNIDEFRLRQARDITRARRPDLWRKYVAKFLSSDL